MLIMQDLDFDKANEILFRLGIIYKQQRKYEDSLQCFDRILRNPPSPLAHADIWFQIGHVYEQQKDVSVIVADVIVTLLTKGFDSMFAPKMLTNALSLTIPVTQRCFNNWVGSITKTVPPSRIRITQYSISPRVWRLVRVPLLYLMAAIV